MQLESSAFKAIVVCATLKVTFKVRTATFKVRLLKLDHISMRYVTDYVIL